jgi:hypothetical protein
VTAFDGVAKARAWYNFPVYQEIKPMRLSAANRRNDGRPGAVAKPRFPTGTAGPFGPTRGSLRGCRGLSDEAAMGREVPQVSFFPAAPVFR